jgi:hypothetical protein
MRARDGSESRRPAGTSQDTRAVASRNALTKGSNNCASHDASRADTRGVRASSTARIGSRVSTAAWLPRVEHALMAAVSAVVDKGVQNGSWLDARKHATASYAEAVHSSGGRGSCVEARLTSLASSDNRRNHSFSSHSTERLPRRAMQPAARARRNQPNRCDAST